jgi:acetaldehyde dehydrogenase (acetylating)
VNSPATHGSVGYSTGLFPAMTLGCGTLGGNITSDNIGPHHLMNIKRIAHELRPVERSAAHTGVSGASAQRATAPVPAPIAAVPAAKPAAPAPAAAVGTVPDRATVARVVERFLSQKGVPRSAEAPAPAPPAPKAAPAPRVADFVSESDVRTAVERAEKIFISPRTIVTPSARDLGNTHNVFIETEAPALAAARD